MPDSHLDDATHRRLLWLRRVRELTPFSPVLREAMETLDDDRSSARDVARVLGRDEAIAAKILRLVNSPLCALRGRVTTVSEAVTLLGFQQIRTLVVVESLLGQGRSRDPLVERNRRSIWEHSLACARWAVELAVATRYRALEEASLAGLLHDIGKIVLAASSPREFAESMALAQQEMLPSHEAEDRLLGTNHIEVGRMVAEHWRFPQQVRQVVTFHHGPWPPPIDLEDPSDGKLKQLLALVRVANPAGKQSLQDNPPHAAALEISVAITAEELLDRARDVDALLQE